MPPRFNKEPINLIHRIPSQKQIDEARPVPPPYGQVLLEAGALCLRKVREFFAYVTRYEDERPPRFRKTLSLSDRTMEQTVVQEAHSCSNAWGTTVVEEQVQEATNPQASDGMLLQSSAQVPQVPTVVQSEEVAELRACLVGQQDEIARLTSHIQELTSLVASQQQVLVHLGKELEAGALSATSPGAAAATVKRSRIGRKKPAASENLNSPQENERPFPSQESEGPSLNL